jgi:predicted ferric reductase
MQLTESRSRRLAGGLFWLSLYLLLVLAPLGVAYVSRDHPARDFWTEFSVALGFVALAMFGLQFAITARFRRVAAPYGIDLLLRFHRQVSLLALTLALAHPLILFATRPETRALLDVTSAPWRARTAVTSVLALLVLVGLSLLRARLGLGYERWRLGHGLLAVAGLTLALVHVELVGWYVDLPWKRVLWAAMVAAVVGMLVYVRLVRPLLLRRRPYRVVRVRPERGRAVTLELEPVGHEGVRFAPGQFAWLTLGRHPLRLEDHPFSFSSSALERERVSFTIKDLGDFTARAGETLPGTTAYVEGPHGAFSIDRYDGPGYVFVAAGVGITPIMSMLRTLADRGDGREHLLLYASRSWEDVTFREELDDLARRLRLEVVHVLGEAPEGWTGECGRISYALLADRVSGERAEHRYFICGPPGMMDSVERDLVKAGVPPAAIASERFNLV